MIVSATDGLYVTFFAHGNKSAAVDDGTTGVFSQVASNLTT